VIAWACIALLRHRKRLSCDRDCANYEALSTNTMHTHTQPFYSSLDFVRNNPGELVPEGTFCHLLDFLVQNEDNTGRHTNNPDGLLIVTPYLPSPPFYTRCPS